MVSVAQVAEEVSKDYEWSLLEDEDGFEHTLYHGTTWANLLGILSAGGFIPGENGHSKCRKYYRGAFGSSSLGEASLKPTNGSKHSKCLLSSKL